MATNPLYRSVPIDQTTLLDQRLIAKRESNRAYMLRLTTENLVRNHLLEAGLWSSSSKLENIHWGWESPTSQIRGHFLGHWLSATSMTAHATNDSELRGKAEAVVAEVGRCQKANGGEWAGSIPEKYLDFIARGRGVWAPHYTLHKTLMGLLDAYRYIDSDEALDIVVRWAPWFLQWTDDLNSRQLENILEVESGGMLEAWSDLYGFTGDADHRTLMDRYTRNRLFEPLLRGEDVLTNMHANTTIPEVLGAARAYEVTGESRWHEIAAAYWDCAVTQRGQYATGGQTSGEIWTPRGELAARLGEKNQEHCTVYNMMRLADYLFRHSGDPAYADYFEQNLINGIMSQGHWRGTPSHGQTSKHPTIGLLSYFLPLRPGSRKGWATETDDFFCCHGTLVQANAHHVGGIYYEYDDGLMVAQTISSELSWSREGIGIRVRQAADSRAGSTQTINSTAPSVSHAPREITFDLSIDADKEVEFELTVRLPWWLDGKAQITVNNEPQEPAESGLFRISRAWHKDTIRMQMPKRLRTWPLPDRPDTVAILDGPVVLAGLCESETIIRGDKEHPDSFLAADNEREWGNWTGEYRTIGQERSIRFVPLSSIGYERYTVYFPIEDKR